MNNFENFQTANTDWAGFSIRRAWTSAAEFAWIAVGALLLLCSILAAPLQIFAPVRLLLGLLYLLYIPGYCIGVALFPRHDDLTEMERMGISLGLSVASVPLVALLLNSLPWGLGLWPIYSGVMGVILLASTVALWRRERIPAAARYRFPAPRRALQNSTRTAQRFWRAALGLGVMVALALVWLFFTPSSGMRTTEFYLVEQDALLAELMDAVPVDEPLEATIGIANRGRRSQTYHVEIWVSSAPDSEQGELVGRAGPFHLDAHQVIQPTVSWQMPGAGNQQAVKLLLFSSAQPGPDPYRTLQLWVDVVAD